MSAKRRARWWSLIIGLILGIVATTTISVWQMIEAREPDNAASAAARQSVLDAVNSAVPKLLSYTPDNAETSLRSATSLLTGQFLDSYTKLINDVVIPGATDKKIAATAQVPAAAVESLTDDKASVLAFINQTVIEPPAEPTDTASSVRVGLQKINGAWLIDAFDPI